MSSRSEWWRQIVSGQRRGIGSFFLRRILWLASHPYGWVVARRNRRFDRGIGVASVSVPVISIGNLTLGGTGKTPCVEYVARLLRETEHITAIISRGYGAETGLNDEALVLGDNLPDVPHFQGPDRVSLARTAIEEIEAEVLVLDDGFQHRKLARNLDIVLIDATNPWGFGCLFPRGMLREPKTSLKRAGFVVITRSDQVDPLSLGFLQQEIAVLAPGVRQALAEHSPLELLYDDQPVDFAEIQGREVIAFCGIAVPESLRQTLISVGAIVRELKVFEDHHPYGQDDVQALQVWASWFPPETRIVTTQKDLVKLRLNSLASRPVMALRIGLTFREGEDAFRETILRTAES